MIKSFKQILIEANLLNTSLVSMSFMVPNDTAIYLKGYLLRNNHIYEESSTGNEIHPEKNQWKYILRDYINQAKSRSAPNSSGSGFIPSFDGETKIEVNQFEQWLEQLKNDLTENPNITKNTKLTEDEIGIITQHFKNMYQRTNLQK